MILEIELLCCQETLYFRMTFSYFKIANIEWFSDFCFYGLIWCAVSDSSCCTSYAFSAVTNCVRPPADLWWAPTG